MKRAGEILSLIFDEKLMKKAQGYSNLFNSWIQITQDNKIAAAADHSRIRELARGVLLIEADHPGWIQILQTKEHKLLDDFRRRFPDLSIAGISLILSRSGWSAASGDKVEPDGSEGNADDTKMAGETAADTYTENISDTDDASGSDNSTQNKSSGYEAIKEGALKDSLKRLEQSLKKARRQGQL